MPQKNYADLPEHTKQARRKASASYIKSHVKTLSLQCNIATDADIIARLDSVPNKAGYIKALIRTDIAKKTEE